MSDEEWLQGLKKHYSDWDDYTTMYQDIAHDFQAGVCQKCDATSNDVHAGSASWLCKGRTQVLPTQTLTPSWFTPVQVNPKKCDCALEVLMQKGCVCSGI